MTPHQLAVRLTGECEHRPDPQVAPIARYVGMCVKAGCMNRVCPDCGVWAGVDESGREWGSWYWCLACRNDRTNSLIRVRT